MQAVNKCISDHEFYRSNLLETKSQISKKTEKSITISQRRERDRSLRNKQAS